MVKLIRLATSNNGVFENTFANNIILSEKAKIALLNITFQVQAGKVLLDDVNSALVFSSQGGLGTTVTNLEQGDLTVNNAFFDQINENLNRLLTDITDLGVEPSGNDLTRASTYSEWQLLRNQAENFNSLTYRYATLCTPFGSSYEPDAPALSTENELLFAYDQNDLVPNATFPPYVKVAPGVQRSELPRYYATVDDQVDGYISSGTALYMARVADFTNNGTLLSDNGFGIGLSIGLPVEPPDGGRQPIPDIRRNFELEFVREGFGYQYRDNDNMTKPSLIVAERASLANFPDVNEHDILWFRIAALPGDQFETIAVRGMLICGVWQLNSTTGEAEERIIFQQYLDESYYKPEGRLYPYFYINGQEEDIVVDSVAYTPSPFSSEDPDNFGSPWQTFGQNDYSLFYRLAFPVDGSPAAEMCKVTPFIDLQRFRVGRPFVFKMHADILKALGFTKLAQITSAQGFVTIEEDVGLEPFYGVNGQWRALSNQESLQALSDNFMVVSDSLQLDSYDASGILYGTGGLDYQSVVRTGQEKQGRRQNILMTIPVNDNNSGIVEFQTNTPIYIDISNTSKLNLRNINFRVLRKDFTPITTLGREAIMTLLIDDN